MLPCYPGPLCGHLLLGGTAVIVCSGSVASNCWNPWPEQKLGISIKTHPGWSLLVAKLHSGTTLDGEVCNYIPLNNWNRCPRAISSSGSNAQYYIILYVVYFTCCLSGSRSGRVLKCHMKLSLWWWGGGPSTDDNTNMVKWELSDTGGSSDLTSYMICRAQVVSGAGWGEVSWSLRTHKSPLGFTAGAVAGQVLSVHYHSSIAFCFSWCRLAGPGFISHAVDMYMSALLSTS